MCSLIFSFETPNGVHSVAFQLKNIQATSKGSDQTATLLVAHTTFLEISCHGSYILEIISCDLSIHTMDNPDFIVCSLMDIQLVSNMFSDTR